jgi:hypothetical protein
MAHTVLRERFDMNTSALRPTPLSGFLGEPEGASQRRAFERVANGLAARLRVWMALPAVRERLDAVEERQPT